jgi:hypothetical protein
MYQLMYRDARQPFGAGFAGCDDGAAADGAGRTYR